MGSLTSPSMVRPGCMIDPDRQRAERMSVGGRVRWPTIATRLDSRSGDVRARSASVRPLVAMIETSNDHQGDRTSMKRNPVAWAALIVASAALVSSSGFLRPMPAAPKVPAGGPAGGQGAVRGLSRRWPSSSGRRSSRSRSRRRRAACPDPGMPNMRRFQVPPAAAIRATMNPRDFEEMLRRFFDPEGDPEKEQFGGRGTRASARASSTTTTATS